MTNVLPKRVNFLLADQIREEAGGKLTIIGLYANDEIILLGDLPEELPIGLQGLALPALSILVQLKDGIGNYNGEAQVIDPNGKPLIIPAKLTISLKENVWSNLIVPFVPFPLPKFGLYTFELKLDNKKYKYTFTIRHSDEKARLPAANNARTESKVEEQKHTIRSIKKTKTRNRTRKN